MRAAVLLQSLLPHRFLSRLVRWGSRWTWAPWKNLLIRCVVDRYGVDLDEASDSDPAAYRHFNAFFTRALKPGARPQPADAGAIVSPADGRISQVGMLASGRILQAKGRDFSAAELFGDRARADIYVDGSFLTVYLSPRDYHRVHMPLAGRLVESVHIPGRIFSVAPFAVAAIPRIFARNERLVCHFDSAHGPFAVVLVGAMLVSGIETAWGGIEVPPYASKTTHRDYRGMDIALARGAEMGRFNMGSTVIVALPGALGRFDPGLVAEQAVHVGQSVGHLNSVKM